MVENLTSEQQAEVKKEVQKQIERQVKQGEKKLEAKIEKEVKKRLTQKLIEKTTIFGSEFKKESSTAIIAAFGFIVALAWRDLITKIIQDNTHSNLLSKYPYIDLLFSAIIVAIIAILGIGLLSNWAKKDETKKYSA